MAPAPVVPTTASPGGNLPLPAVAMKQPLPLVYSCSGASSAAQLANHVAVRLDRLGVAEMSCIAGVGGDVKPLVRTAKSERPIIALDGCALRCVLHILKRHDIQPARHIVFSDFGIKKRLHEDFAPEEAQAMLEQVLADPPPPR